MDLNTTQEERDKIEAILKGRPYITNMCFINGHKIPKKFSIANFTEKEMTIDEAQKLKTFMVPAMCIKEEKKPKFTKIHSAVTGYRRAMKYRNIRTDLTLTASEWVEHISCDDFYFDQPNDHFDRMVKDGVLVRVEE